jgi:hypothetical protein
MKRSLKNSFIDVFKSKRSGKPTDRSYAVKDIRAKISPDVRKTNRGKSVAKLRDNFGSEINMNLPKKHITASRKMSVKDNRTMIAMNKILEKQVKEFQSNLDID